MASSTIIQSCGDCGGTGTIRRYSTVECPHCHGHGVITCDVCAGEGNIEYVLHPAKNSRRLMRAVRTAFVSDRTNRFDQLRNLFKHQTPVQLLDEEVELNPDISSLAWMFRAEEHLKLNNDGPQTAIEYHNKAVDYYRRGNYTNSIKYFEAAIKSDTIDPWSPSYLGLLYATCPDMKVRSGDLALKYTQMAIERCKIEHWKLVANLAAAQAECLDFSNALVTAERALRIAPKEYKMFALVYVDSFRLKKRIIDYGFGSDVL